MELVDAFDQAGPSYPNVYGKALFSNQNNFRGRNKLYSTLPQFDTGGMNPEGMASRKCKRKCVEGKR